MTLRDYRALQSRNSTRSPVRNHTRFRARSDTHKRGRNDVWRRAGAGSWKSVVVVLAGIWAVSGCAPEPAVNVQLTGTLVWNDEQQTLTACDGSATYLVRIVASNPNFYVYYRVQELEAHNPGQAIIATVEAVVKAVPSPAPPYPVDGVLFVNRIHGLESGTCQ